MTECTCPEKVSEIPQSCRVELVQEGAVTFVEGKKVVDKTRFHVFHKDCPIHGYKDITEYE